MAKIKVLAGSWKDQVGEFVRELEGEFASVPVTHEVTDEKGNKGEVTELQPVMQPGKVLARMAGNRLIEFAAEHVERVTDEPAAEPVKE